MKIVSLNLNHKARLRAIKPRLVEAIDKLGPDVLVLNEYVNPSCECIDAAMFGARLVLRECDGEDTD